MINIAPQIVALLFGLIPVGDHSIRVQLEFKNIEACNVAKAALETKHRGAKLSCLDNAVHTRGLSSTEGLWW
jgi:hypothetical protein